MLPCADDVPKTEAISGPAFLEKTLDRVRVQQNEWPLISTWVLGSWKTD
jgi:hypothetical protein